MRAPAQRHRARAHGLEFIVPRPARALATGVRGMQPPCVGEALPRAVGFLRGSPQRRAIRYDCSSRALVHCCRLRAICDGPAFARSGFGLVAFYQCALAQPWLVLCFAMARDGRDGSAFGRRWLNGWLVDVSLVVARNVFAGWSRMRRARLLRGRR